MMVTVGVLLVWGGSGRAHAEAGPASKVDYVTQIKPILKSRCYACHGALKQKANLRLDAVALARTGGDSGPAWEPGQPAASPILERIAATDDAERMPPDGKPLTAEQIALLTAWISQGAAAPANDAPETDPREHWAFQKPRRPELPAATPEGGEHPLDRLLAAEWAARGLTPVGAADPATLLRRVSFDLIGLPPTRDELHAFLADTSPDAYVRAVERLLASPHYGERWGRHWMDVWRYSDWYGRRSVPDVMNSYPQIWRWRDWILRSLNEDKGYDRMLVEMLAADEVAPDDQQNVVATGFIVRNWFKWNYDTWLRDQVEHTGKAFLGLSFNCALCHDHKYDPISQTEYFQLRAVFEPLELRHDRLAGEPDPGPFQKYIYGKPYGPISNGLIRVFDEKLDADVLGLPRQLRTLPRTRGAGP
jgi:mono/diheme cytochrome c family protein